MKIMIITLVTWICMIGYCLVIDRNRSRKEKERMDK